MVSSNSQPPPVEVGQSSSSTGLPISPLKRLPKNLALPLILQQLVDNNTLVQETTGACSKQLQEGCNQEIALDNQLATLRLNHIPKRKTKVEYVPLPRSQGLAYRFFHGKISFGHLIGSICQRYLEFEGPGNYTEKHVTCNNPERQLAEIKQQHIMGQRNTLTGLISGVQQRTQLSSTLIEMFANMSNNNVTTMGSCCDAILSATYSALMKRQPSG